MGRSGKLTRVCDTNENEKSYKLLGVWFDEHLTFDTHVKNLCTKLTRALFFIRHAQNFLTDKALVSLYYALFHSHLLYCPLIISSTSEKKSQKNLSVTKKAIRIIVRAKNTEHAQPIFLKLKILPYELIVKQSKLNFMHSIKFNYAPESFKNTWIMNEDRERAYELRNNPEFLLPAPRIEFF